MDWRQTVNLPRTDFPMRANLPQREPQVQEGWRQGELYRRIREARRGQKRFVLHDGPPYANGEIHMGTTLNKVLKDIVVRYATMRGYDAPFVPGWDTHGLPIERRAIEVYGLDRATVSPVELRERCREFALHYMAVMTSQFQRLGVLGDWENPYATLDPEYEARQIEAFGEMARRGYIYRDLKCVYWCAECETALAEAEIEYRHRHSPSIWVAFDVEDGAGRLPPGSRVVIWTTTPWTLPGNAAIALHPDAAYRLVDTERGQLLVAAERHEAVAAELGMDPGRVARTFRGRELEGIICRHPFLPRRVPLVLAEYVALTEGTGAVHTAPGHGPEDFETGRRYGLPVIVPIDGRGVLTAEAGPFAGSFYLDANASIVAALQQSGHLLAAGTIEHSYAHCWRCKNPVLWRATEQWFIRVEAFRRQALEAIAGVRWIPPAGRTRIESMVAERGDWCISRQRVWGVPIPVLYCLACGFALLDDEVIERVVAVFRQEGSNSWYLRPASDFLPAGKRCPQCGHGEFRKETDIMDVWFDSGISHLAVLEGRSDLHWPADLYLEGSDQHRGWFQTSLLTAVAARGGAPYRAVVTHGFVLDGQGRAMHKSLGNVIPPEQLITRFGADVLRLWAASSDWSSDVRVSEEIVGQAADMYRKIRNTIRFCLGNLYDYNPSDEALWDDLDRWALHRLGELIRRCTRAFDEYAYHHAVHALHQFCAVDMSALYLEVSKDRLYCSAPDDPARRGAQAVLEAVARTITLLMAPILPHTAEEVWQYLPHRGGDPASVHLALWPEAPEVWRDEALADRWERFFRWRDAILRAIEQKRATREIDQALDARVEVFASEGIWQELQPFSKDLAALLVASQAQLAPLGDAPPDAVEVASGLRVRIIRAPGQKCSRCWRVLPDVREDRRFPELCARCADVVARTGAAPTAPI